MKFLFLALAFTTLVTAQEWQPLWPGDAPGAPRPAKGSESVNGRSHYTNIEVPQFALYQPKDPNGQCVVLLPGGGYAFVSMSNEGTQIAEWLVSEGVTVVLVKYRVSRQPKFGYQFPIPLLDARRAIRTARAKAKEWKIDPQKVGVMGFSAGGHLASCCATMFDDPFEAETNDEIDAVSCRPDFQILGYPVIAMGTSYGHQGSQNQLLGTKIFPKQAAKFNTTKRLTKNSPPLYFVHSADDYAVPLRNTSDYIARCAELKIPVSGQVFPSGGHGFGQKGRRAAVGWTKGLAAWLKTLR